MQKLVLGVTLCCILVVVAAIPVTNEENKERNLLKEILDVLEKRNNVYKEDLEKRNYVIEESVGEPLLISNDHDLSQRKAAPAYANYFVNAHNFFRNFHKAPTVSWDANLAQGALSWAKTIVGEAALRHSNANGAYGENLYTFSASIAASDVTTCKRAVFTWYGEVVYYDYTKGAPKTKGQTTGHFTQVVWAKTTGIGCGIASGPDPKNKGFIKTLVCCRYSPAGNNGQYIANVMVPTPNPAPVASFNAVKTK